MHFFIKLISRKKKTIPDERGHHERTQPYLVFGTHILIHIIEPSLSNRGKVFSYKNFHYKKKSCKKVKCNHSKALEGLWTSQSLLHGMEFWTLIEPNITATSLDFLYFKNYNTAAEGSWKKPDIICENITGMPNVHDNYYIFFFANTNRNIFLHGKQIII